MKIQFEVGDRVYRSNEYEGESYKIVALRKNGVVLENRAGERFFAGKNRIEPHPGTIDSATRSAA